MVGVAGRERELRSEVAAQKGTWITWVLGVLPAEVGSGTQG